MNNGAISYFQGLGIGVAIGASWAMQGFYPHGWMIAGILIFLGALLYEIAFLR